MAKRGAKKCRAFRRGELVKVANPRKIGWESTGVKCCADKRFENYRVKEDWSPVSGNVYRVVGMSRKNRLRVQNMRGRPSITECHPNHFRRLERGRPRAFADNVTTKA